MALDITRHDLEHQSWPWAPPNNTLALFPVNKPTYWHERQRCSRCAIRRTTGNTVSVHYFHHYYVLFLFFSSYFLSCKSKTYIWENFVRKANQSSLLTLILHEIVWVLSILLKLKFLIDYFIRFKPEGVPQNQNIFLLFAKTRDEKNKYSIPWISSFNSRKNPRNFVQYQGQ